MPLSVETVNCDLIGAGAGDLIIIEPGERDHLHILNCSGILGNRLTIKNGDGVVGITASSGEVGIRIMSSRHFNFLGNGSADPYGFIIRETQGIWGMRVFRDATNFTITNIEITGVSGVAGAMFTQQLGETWRDVSLKNWYVHDIEGECIYAGSARTVFHPEGTRTPIQGFEIVDSVLERCGQDGLQFQGVHDISVRNVEIQSYGTSDTEGHREGIRCGRDCYGTFEDILIENGCGHGVYVGLIRGGVQFSRVTVRNAGFLSDGALCRVSSSVRLYRPSGGEVDFIEVGPHVFVNFDDGVVSGSAGVPFSYLAIAGNNRISDVCVVADVPSMSEDDMLSGIGSAPLTFTGNYHVRGEGDC